jgi:hypothetical protein
LVAQPGAANGSIMVAVVDRLSLLIASAPVVHPDRPAELLVVFSHDR